MYALNHAHNTHTVHAAYSPPDHRRISYGTTVPGADEGGQERPWEARGPPQKLCHKLIPYVTTHHGRQTKRTSCRHTPKPNSHSATNHDGELCVPHSDTSIVVPYSAAPMCQLADALRFGHAGACLHTIWCVPVHLLPYHRGIDPSERSHRAAYCLQQRCLVRPCVVFTNSASHPSERWHRGCLAKP